MFTKNEKRASSVEISQEKSPSGGGGGERREREWAGESEGDKKPPEKAKGGLVNWRWFPARW